MPRDYKRALATTPAIALVPAPSQMQVAHG